MTGTAGRGRGRVRGRGASVRGGFMNYGNQNFNTPLGVNQCAFCKQEGHWKRDCPRNRNAQQEIAKLMVLDD